MCPSNRHQIPRALIHPLVNACAISIARVRRAKISDDRQMFWTQEQKKFFRNGLSLLFLAREPVTIRNLYRILRSSAEKPDQCANEAWRGTSYVYGLLAKAQSAGHGHADFEEILQYYLRDWPSMREGERSLVKADLTGLLDGLSRGDIGELFSTTTNLTPDDILRGAIVVVDIPEREYLEVGQYCALIWSQLLQRAVDRRDYQCPADRPIFLWQDDAICLLATGTVSSRRRAARKEYRWSGSSRTIFCSTWPTVEGKRSTRYWGYTRQAAIRPNKHRDIKATFIVSCIRARPRLSGDRGH